MTAGDGSARRRSSLLAGVGVSLGTAAWGLLQLLQSTLPSFHLRATPQLLIALSIGVIGVAVAARAAAKARRDADDALHADLDAALACWPPRTAVQISPYDLGAHPTGAAPEGDDGAPRPPYVSREADEAVASALAAPGLVLVYGPGRAGKSRCAYEAVRERCPEARVLVPEDAAGLRAVLAHAGRLRAIVGGPLVLWLDEVERFLPGLDLDALDRLAAAPDGMRTVATIGEDRLASLLAEDPGDGAAADRHLARRLLARARAVRLPAPAASERQDVADAAAATGSLRAQLAGGWWPAPLPPAPAVARRRGFDVVSLALGALATGLVVATLIAGFGDGWTEPAPLGDQLAALQDDAPECETLALSPARAEQIGQRTVVAVVARRALCLDSDEVRLYRVRSGRLRELATLDPPRTGPRWTFACVGPRAADPCGVSVAAGARVLVGAWADGRTHRALPVALRPLDDRLNLASLAPDRPALAWAAFAGSETRQAVLVGGHLAEGTPDTPRRLRARARQLLLDEAGAPTTGRACWIFTRGQRVAVSAPVASRATASADLARAWRSALAKRDSAVVC